MDPPDYIKLEPSTSKAITTLFLALEVSGAFGMALILLSAIVSRKVKRLATWYTFCFSWSLSCVSYLLLFFSGEIHEPEPTKAICITQAALIYSVPTLYVPVACSCMQLICSTCTARLRRHSLFSSMCVITTNHSPF